MIEILTSYALLVASTVNAFTKDENQANDNPDATAHRGDCQHQLPWYNENWFTGAISLQVRGMI